MGAVCPWLSNRPWQISRAPPLLGRNTRWVSPTDLERPDQPPGSRRVDSHNPAPGVSSSIDAVVRLWGNGRQIASKGVAAGRDSRR